MTLSTDVIVLDPINPKDVFDFCLGMLGAFVDFEPQWEHTNAHEGRGYRNAYYNSVCGQGLPAWLFVHYAIDGPLCLYAEDEIAEYRAEDPTWTPPVGNEHCVRVDFDTAYSWKGPNGETCGTLHAALVQALGAWLDTRNVRWQWRNEFTGEWFEGATGFDTLADGALAAVDWFTNKVKPVLGVS